MEDGAIAADLAITQWKPNPYLEVTALHWPGQQLSGQISCAAISWLYIFEEEPLAELALETLLRGLPSGEGLEISGAHEEPSDQMYLTMPQAIRGREGKLLCAIKNLRQRATGEIASNPPITNRLLENRLIETPQQVVLTAGEALLLIVITRPGHGVRTLIRCSTSSRSACTTESHSWRLRSRGSGSSS